MSSTIRTVRLGISFTDGGRAMSIRRSRSCNTCACGMPFHQINVSELFIHASNRHTGEYEHWHQAHLESWKLIVIDKDGQEVARFGC